MKKALLGFLALVGSVVVVFALANWWPYIFAKNVEGQLTRVERLMDPIAVITKEGEPSTKVFSFAVAIRDQKTGEIFTASSEDRQWAAVQPEDMCVEAKFYPYAPWKLEKAGTYFGARLLRSWSCSQGKPK